MAILPYSPENFGGTQPTKLRQPGVLNISWPQVLWAIVTAGKKSIAAHVIQHGTSARLEILWRIAIVRSVFSVNTDQEFEVTSLFRELDPSEQGALQYFIGCLGAKIVGVWLLDVPKLLHFHVYRAALNPVLALSSWPDFVGKNTRGDWVVVEAKGRKQKLYGKDRQRAKRQTRSLRRIDGVYPVLRVLSTMHLSSFNLRAHILDPDDYDEDAIDIKLDPEKCSEEYYRAIRDLLLSRRDGTRTVNGKVYCLTHLPEVDAAVGLRLDIFNNIVTSSPETETEPREEALRRLIDMRKMAKERFYAGEDGVAVWIGESWIRS